MQALDGYINRVNATWRYLYERRNSDPDQLQFPFYELQCARMDPPRRLRLNAELLAKAPERGINRTEGEMDNLGDPIWDRLRVQERERLFSLTDRTYSVMQRMLERTMTATEYEQLAKGTHWVFKKPGFVREAFALMFLAFASTGDTPNLY